MEVPPGFSRAAPYFIVQDVPEFVQFVCEGRGGSEGEWTLRPDGAIANVILEFGTASVMAGEASVEFWPMAAAYCL